MKFLVYILYSESEYRFYIGHTQDLDNRMRQHNNGETKSIRFGVPWRIVWHAEFPSRSEAMRIENKIKNRGAKRFLMEVSRGA